MKHNEEQTMKMAFNYINSQLRERMKCVLPSNYFFPSDSRRVWKGSTHTHTQFAFMNYYANNQRFAEFSLFVIGGALRDRFEYLWFLFFLFFFSFGKFLISKMKNQFLVWNIPLSYLSYFQVKFYFRLQNPFVYDLINETKWNDSMAHLSGHIIIINASIIRIEIVIFNATKEVARKKKPKINDAK